MFKRKSISKNEQVGKSELTSEKAIDVNQQSPKELEIDQVIQNLEVSRNNDFSTYQIYADREEVSLEVIERILTLSEKNELQIRNAHISYVEKICNRLNASYPISFIYDIRSCNSDVLKFWEPQKQSFEERFESLKLVDSKGFRTIVFCSNPLDGDTFELVEILTPHSDFIIVEITKKLEEFLFESELIDSEKVKIAEEVLKIQSVNWLLNLGEKLKNNSSICWDPDTREFLESKIGQLN